jgi:hypothetical protein
MTDPLPEDVVNRVAEAICLSYYDHVIKNSVLNMFEDRTEYMELTWYDWIPQAQAAIRAMQRGDNKIVSCKPCGITGADGIRGCTKIPCLAGDNQ